MRNVEISTTTTGKLSIVVDLEAETVPSKSGKTDVIASTEGNVYLADYDITVGLNVYRRASR